MNRPSNRKVRLAFETASLRIPLSDIETLRDVSDPVRRSMKYGQIAASMQEVGIIEPPVVVRLPGDRERYRLLDGHLRLDILRIRGRHRRRSNHL